MKNEYFGDINDYRKYGLLRCVATAGFTIGVCWMLTPDVGNGDGLKTQYLRSPQRWRHFDPELFDAIVGAVDGSTSRSVNAIARSNLINRAKYFGQVLPPKRAERVAYFGAAWSALDGCDLLFFDPDNGLEISSVPYGTLKSPKYLYWSEVERAWEIGASLIVFQHFAREARQTHVERLSSEVANRTGGLVLPIHTGHVLFLVILQRLHEAKFAAALSEIRAKWDGQLMLEAV